MNTTPLTPDSVLAAPTHPEQAPDAYDWRNDPQLSEKWKKRFAFYDSLPPAGTSPFRETLNNSLCQKSRR